MCCFFLPSFLLSPRVDRPHTALGEVLPQEGGWKQGDRRVRGKDREGRLLDGRQQHPPRGPGLQRRHKGAHDAGTDIVSK